MGATWKTIPLFISSTFRDMHAERDQLNRVVFPALEERLKARRCRLEPIDLRVGVETDSTKTERERELQILKVCLAEIERSRPFLLVLLGDRYGWVPGEDRIKAAASEAGFSPEDERASVTALEIEYGLLKKDPVQRRRCLLCLRQPLPYDRMPPDRAAIYSDEHGTDPDAPERAQRLKLLKAKINHDPQLAPHRFPYRLDWDDQIQRPRNEGSDGLAAWGRKVESALWQLLDAETQHLVNQAEPTWEKEERFAIEEMVERLNGSFVGRTGLVQQALDLALSSVAQASAPAGSGDVPHSGASTGVTLGPLAPGKAALPSWGLCFTGASGSGKSALFARLHHQLSTLRTGATEDGSTLNSQPLVAPKPGEGGSILLLSHAAGISPRAGLTDSMLRRWVGELAAALGEAAPAIPDDIKPEELEKLFGQWLARAATSRRVVVLVDALNQFLRTERARTVSWLPALWPDNARFIATTIAGEESQRLGQRPGVSLCEVPPLSAAEADAITVQVHARYHREPNKEVMAGLLSQRLPEGAPAAGNPLWLTLALDLLNLLDADDFTTAEAVAGGTPEQRLRRMLLDRAQALPGTAEAIYGHLLAHIEKVAGVAEARAFVALIALSRHGWREEDLQHLLPKAAELLVPSQPSGPQPSTLNPQPFPWDPLRFAMLRRLFRAHLVKRGALEQFDFAHASLRAAIRAQLEGEWQTASGKAGLVPRVYTCGADYLETMPPGTSVRGDEIMWQMLGTRDADRVARYYAQPTSGSKMLALFLTEDEATAGHPLRQFARALVRPGVAEAATQAAVANKFNFDLNDVLEIEGHLPLRKELLTAAHDSLSNLAAADPSNAGWQRDLSVSHNKVGDVLRAQGDLAGALQAHRESLAVAQRLAAADPSNAGWQRDLSVSHVKIGEVLGAQGDLAGALQAYGESLAVAQRLADGDPSNAGWQRNLCASQQRIGDVLEAQGDLAGALEAYREYQAEMQCLAAADPSNAGWQRALSLSHSKLGDLAKDQAKLPEAERYFAQALAIAQRLADADPSNAGWQRDLLVSQEKIGDVLRAQGDLAGALQTYRECQAGMQRFAVTDPSNVGWQRDLSVGQNRIGDVLRAQGDLSGALQAYRESLAVAQRLAATEPSNADWQRDLSISFDKLGDLAQAQGKLSEAESHFKQVFAIRERLAQANPGNNDARQNLRVSNANLADFYAERRDLAQSQGNLAEAESDCAQALAVVQRLAQADPADNAWQQLLCNTFDKLGHLSQDQGKLPEAERYFAQALAIAQRLAGADASNAGWQRGLSVSHEKTANLLLAQGDLAGALQAHRKSLAIRERLAAVDPSNAGWQCDLASAHCSVGMALHKQGELADALEAYRKYQTGMQRLAAADPSNAGWQRELSVSQERIGNVLLAQGDLAGALRAYRESLAVRQALAWADSSNAGWQRDLSVSHAGIGDVLLAQRDLAGGLRAYRKSLEVSQALALADPSNVGWQRDLSVIRDKVGDMLRAQGDLAGALSVYHESLAVRQRLAAADPTDSDLQMSLVASYHRMMRIHLRRFRFVSAFRVFVSLTRHIQRLPDEQRMLLLRRRPRART